ncbi:alpha/beta fold hydrolase [bacterium]|nr:alpha/beta fold hydrolase [bacterium]
MTDFARYLNVRSATSPVLSPDGRRVAFLSDITGNYQVWSIATDPNSKDWPRQLTFFADKVWELHGSGAADHLLAVSDVGGNEKQQFYLITNYGGKDGHDVRRLTHQDDAIHRFGGWSGDGRRILYTSNARNSIDFDLYVMDIGGGEPQFLCEMAGNREVMAWSPDNRQVLVREQVGPLEDRLFVVTINDFGASEQCLTDGITAARYEQVRWEAHGVYLISDRHHDRGALCRLNVESGELDAIVTAEIHDGEGEIELLAVNAQGTRAAYTFNAGGYSELWVLELSTHSSRRIEDVPGGQIGKIKFRGEGQVIFDLMTPNQPANVWTADLVSGDLNILTQSETAGIAPSSFVLPDLIHFESFDGRQIPAFYYLPLTPRPDGGYPCILYVHGGPTSQLRPDFDVRFQYFLSRGYAILGTNVRGSGGYGRAYAELDELEKRPDSVADLKYAVHWLQGRAEINGGRVAIYGRSYGGFMVLAALTAYPELFAAGINVVGIANWVSFMERTSPWRRAHREKEYGSLAHHRDLLTQISPIHKAERITMPLMVIAGDNDPRVPLFESEQIVERVRNAGGTVEFLHYADEGHKISKLANRVDSFTRMADFLDRHL